MSVTHEPAKFGSRATYLGARQSSTSAKQLKLHMQQKALHPLIIFSTAC